MHSKKDRNVHRATIQENSHLIHKLCGSRRFSRRLKAEWVGALTISEVADSRFTEQETGKCAERCLCCSMLWRAETDTYAGCGERQNKISVIMKEVYLHDSISTGIAEFATKVSGDGYHVNKQGICRKISRDSKGHSYRTWWGNFKKAWNLDAAQKKKPVASNKDILCFHCSFP